MRELLGYFQNRGNLFNLVVLLVLVVALPVGIYLTRVQQILKSQAAIEPIVFLEGGCVQKQGLKVVATCPEVTIQLTSPLGPPATGSADKDKHKDKDKNKDKKKENKEEKKKDKEEKKKDKNKDKNKDKDEGSWVWWKNLHALLDRLPLEVDLNGAVRNVYAGHIGQESDFCEPDGVSLSHESAADGSHTFIKDCRDEGKVCRDGACVEDSGSTDFCKDSEYVFKKCDPDDCGFEIWTCPKNGANKIIKTPSGGDCSNPSKNPVCQSQGGSGSCQVESQSPPLSSSCAECIIKNDPDLPGSIKNKDTQKFSCYQDNQLLNYWCNSGLSKGPEGDDCTGKKAICGTACSQDLKNTCQIGFQDPSLSSSCVKWLSHKGLQNGHDYCDTGTCLVESVRREDRPKFANCTDTQILNYWCNGGVTAGKTNPDCTLKKTEGGLACSSSSGKDGSKDGGSKDGGSSGKDGGGGGGKGDSKPSPTSNTTSFKLSEIPDGLAQAPSQPYDQHPKIIPHTFSSSAPGIKTIFVEFVSKNGQKDKRTASIELVAPAPLVSLAKCSLASFGEGINLELTGQRFGALPGQLTLKGLANSSATITSWSDSQLSATVNLPGGSEVIKNVNFVLTRSDGASIEGACLVGEEAISLALGTKLFCRADSSLDQKGVEIIILENTPGTKPKKETVTIDRDGLVDLQTKVVNGKVYRVSVKAPHSLRRSSQPFTALEGTVQLTFLRNNADDINTNALPIGDIFPAPSGDGKIDTRDALELFRQWGSPLSGSALTSSLRPGDFNQDGKVNAIDWACMRYDFGTSDDEPLK